MRVSMKILHICVTGPYTDNLNYQENLITKYQVKAGNEVFLIAPQWEWGEDGKVRKTVGDTEYVNADGVSVYRLSIRGDKNVFFRYKIYEHFYDTLEKVLPDIIFVHNLQFFDVGEIVRYAKSHQVKIFVDNHADFSNSARSRLAVMFYKIFWRHMAHIMEPYTTRFFGVLPARVDFLMDVYHVSEKKCELLVMGADDEAVEVASEPAVKKKIRDRYHVGEQDFLIVTGGKIDSFKTQTLLLMEAVKQIDEEGELKQKVKLLIFGSIDDTIREEFDALCDDKTIQYIGWAKGIQPYEFFGAADLVVFPGRHSVYWEQVVAQGIPMLCKYWDGTTHVDIGGNVHFLQEDSVELMKREIANLIQNPGAYEEMKRAAMCEKRRDFLYSQIAAKALL